MDAVGTSSPAHHARSSFVGPPLLQGQRAEAHADVRELLPENVAWFARYLTQRLVQTCVAGGATTCHG